MKLETGEIYFIRERDYFTKEVSPYVKIGLIHEKEGRTNEARMEEHQTGNPRLLYIYDSLKTAAVDHIEALLHRLYATKRISGEWFKFDSDAELDVAIEKANSLATETAALIPTFEKVDEFQESKKIGDSISATPEVLALMNEYQFKNSALKEYAKLLGDISMLLKVAVERGDDVEGVATVSTRKAPDGFDLEKFISDHPELHLKYSIETTTSARRFTWSTRKVPQEILDQVAQEISPQLIPYTEIIEAFKIDSNLKFELNQANLELVELKSIAQWDCDLAEAKVRLACGTNAGIEGVCKWPLNTSTKSTLSKKALEQDLPDIFAKYVIKGEVTQTVRVQPRQAPGATTSE